MSGRDGCEPLLDLRGFLPSVAIDPLPEDVTDELDEAVIADRLRQLGGSDDAWIERWVGRALEQRDGRELDHAQRLTEPLSALFEDLAEMTADLGLWAGLASFALNRRGDLEPAERELLEAALRDAAAAGARARARVDQARCLLATIDEANS